MNWTIIITLIIIGIVALVIEFLVVPGAIVGILGTLCIIAGVVFAYSEYGVVAGNITLLSTALLIVILVVLILRSKTWKRISLDTQITSKANDDTKKLSVGMEGVALSRLAPGGKGKFGEEIVEIFSIQGFVDENTPVVIVKIEGNKVTVKVL